MVFVLVTDAWKALVWPAFRVVAVGSIEIDTAATVACARAEKLIKARVVASDLGLKNKGYFLR